MNFAKLTLLCSTATILAAALPSRAQSATPSAPQLTTTAATRPPGPDIEDLTLHPSPATRPWLQFRLLPDVADQTPGNAVTLYLLARNTWPDQKTTDEVLSPENGKFNYLDTPIDQFPPQYAQRLLDVYAETLAKVDLGARRRDAIWDTGWRERGFSGKYPFQYLDADLRHVENLLNFRGRLQVSRKDWAGAQYTIQTALGIAQHVGNEPLLIHGLVEAGFAELTLRRTIEEWVAHEGSPNLYWDLVDLPPFDNLKCVSQGSNVDLRFWKPQIAQAMNGSLPANQWPQALREMVGMLRDSRPPYKRDPAEVGAEATRLTESTYPRARQNLLSTGMTEQAIGSISREQVVGAYFCQQYRAASEDLWKVFPLPYPQAEEQMLRSWHAFAPDQSPIVDNPLFQAGLVSYGSGKPEYRFPNVLNIRYQLARTERLIALFRTIEALRDYAAHHAGQPPHTLDQITELPVPLDPVTGHAFTYIVQSQTVTLDALAPAYRSPYSGWRYELTFVK